MGSQNGAAGITDSKAQANRTSKRDDGRGGNNIFASPAGG